MQTLFLVGMLAAIRLELGSLNWEVLTISAWFVGVIGAFLIRNSWLRCHRISESAAAQQSSRRYSHLFTYKFRKLPIQMVVSTMFITAVSATASGGFVSFMLIVVAGCGILFLLLVFLILKSFSNYLCIESNVMRVHQIFGSQFFKKDELERVSLKLIQDGIFIPMIEKSDGSIIFLEKYWGTRSELSDFEHFL